MDVRRDIGRPLERLGEDSPAREAKDRSRSECTMESDDPGVPCIVYESESQHRLLELLRRVAPTDAEILITGPTGVGKELYAQYVHACSRRREHAFVPVNCSNLSSELLENEIFGHARGAYTGAYAAGTGLVSVAAGGTMFFDEIDTLSGACQAKLLRFVQSKEYRRLGETIVRRVDVRFIAASNVDLTARVREGRFREDLFFRLRVVPVEVPPLAQRKDDVAPLLDHFVARYAEEYELEPIRLSDAALASLHDYPWPGNVRELENCVRYLTCMQLDAAVEPKDLALCLMTETWSDVDDEIVDLPLREAKARLIAEFERLYLDQALERSAGNVSAAARASGKHRRAFFELMRKYGMDAARYRAGASQADGRPFRGSAETPFQSDQPAPSRRAAPR